MNGLLDGLIINTQPSRDEEHERDAATGRLAVTTVRKIALRHDRRCRGDCRHRNHRRDHAGLADGLEILGLDEGPAQPEDYESPIGWASLSRSDAVNMTGRTYGD
jgi:hypothetical protein